VEAVVAAAGVVAEIKRLPAMKTIIIYSVLLITSLICLFFMGSTMNPIALKGPDFLRFYLILLFGFYASVFALKIAEEPFSGVTRYGMIFIFILGAIKLIRGIFLGKSVGFLLWILVVEGIVFLLINSNHVNRRIK
jgi:FtsH-binding integral membrane protein